VLVARLWHANPRTTAAHCLSFPCFNPQGVKPGNYIAYWEAFPAVIPDSGSLYARLAIGTTDELANLAIPVRNNNVFERSRSELWIRMVARVMAINWDSRVKCDLVSLLVLGPVSLWWQTLG
jgi:hypothetical protein